ncbi:MAG TPA: hypothetical protein VE994_10230 [Terriglobales bacterium]|nr:hypothetical protein [Terriglobales bacterium]
MTTTSTHPQGASNADQLDAVERAIEMALYYPSPQDNGWDDELQPSGD